MKPRFVTLVALAIAGCSALACRKAPPPPDPPRAREWQLLASELPSALLSVTGRSASDVYAVGADKGRGPYVLHFDGRGWTQLHTGQSGDLWWAQALPDGRVLMAGAHATVLRFDGRRFERLETPGLPEQTVYGVWGADAESFYAVGSAAGRNGFIWRRRGGAFEKEALPLDLPRTALGEIPGFFKVWGSGDDVWVVGAAGIVLHRKGAAPFALVQSGTKETLFTVHGTGERLLAVGGTGNGVLLEATKGGAFHAGSPAGAGLIQGVFATDGGDWASGERGAIYTRAAGSAGPFAAVDHGLMLPPASSLHSIFVDASGGVWSAGGNVLGPALDDGMLVHYGTPVPPVTLDDEDPAPADGASSKPR